MSLKKTLLATVAILSVGIASAASPNPATATFQVKFKVLKACTVAATDLDLGSQESTGAVIAAAGTGTVTVTCSKKTPYTIGLQPSGGSLLGAGVMGPLNSPVVYSPVNADTVAYQLYQNSGLTTVWGNTVGTNTVGGTGTGAAQTAVSVYGKVTTTPLTLVTPDSYSDTVTVSVAY